MHGRSTRRGTCLADGVILDLEDAVAPDAKPMAREQIAQAVTAAAFGSA
jgi:citrate lyase subunit beta/citryl-CoA lyase